MMTQVIGVWNQIAARAGVNLSQSQHELFDRYLDLLLAANRQMNLTRITDRPSAELGHIGDSLTLLAWLPKEPIRLADVGSGGGVPGIPLAIARPDARVVLIESTRKKAAFLKWAAAELGLANVLVIDRRVEEAGLAKDLRESFDVVVFRAVGTLNWLAEWCLPLLKVGGKMLAMKGPKAAEELPLAEHAIRLVGGGSPDVRPVELPGATNHVIVEVVKKRHTPASYPRHPSVAKGKPL
jgi:16S rRNA (guanine527-N7)-methyltransferase